MFRLNFSVVATPTPLIYGVNLIKTVSFNEIVSIRARYAKEVDVPNQ